MLFQSRKPTPPAQDLAQLAEDLSGLDPDKVVQWYGEQGDVTAGQMIQELRAGTVTGIQYFLKLNI